MERIINYKEIIIGENYREIDNAINDLQRAMGFEESLHREEKGNRGRGARDRFSKSSKITIDISYKLKRERRGTFEKIPGYFKILAKIDNNRVIEGNKNNEEIFIEPWNGNNNQNWTIEHNEVTNLYLIRNLEDNRALTWDNLEGETVVACKYIEGAKQQLWLLEEAEEDSFIIKTASDSTKALQIVKAKGNKSSNLVVRNKNNRIDQKFKFIKF
ncbi:MAG: RICIN domain-containing protein [Sarcina sp.]